MIYGGGQVVLPLLNSVVVQYDTVCPANGDPVSEASGALNGIEASGALNGIEASGALNGIEASGALNGLKRVVH